MKLRKAILCVAAIIWSCQTATSLAGPYQSLVIGMDPTYYYELNETDTSTGAVDTMGRGPVGSYNGDYDGGGPEVGIPGPDFLFEGGAWTFSNEWDDVGEEIDLVGLGEGNLAHASNNAGHITLGDGSLFAANAMTVAMFARGGPADGGDRLFTNNVTDPLTSFQIVVGNDGLVVSTNPTVECLDEIECGHRSLFLPGEGVEFSNQGADRGLNSDANGWWHIVASTQGTTALERTENIRVWLNGVDRTEDMLPGTVGWGTDTGLAKIGGRRDDPLDSTTHSGAQDEVAIWLDRVLTDEEAQALYQAAISDSIIGDFNQNGQLDLPDIDDLTSQSAAGTNNPTYDLNADALVNTADVSFWIRDLRGSWVGDADLNGEFNSTDLVSVLAAGKYESGTASVWSEGDFNGDGRTDSGDLVAALADGGYEMGPRAAVAAVPEPATALGAALGLLLLVRAARRTGQFS
jgi:hypothetical protein